MKLQGNALLEKIGVPAVPEIDIVAAEDARLRQDQLTKPTGSLGRLESLSIQLAGIAGKAVPEVDPAVVFVFAADHGVAVSRQVSLYPAEVTGQMVLNYVAGGAVINVLTRALGGRVVVADVGVASALPAGLPIYYAKVAPGTADWSAGPAMSREQALKALRAGVDCFENEWRLGRVGMSCIGEMGIGNTTTASALAAALLALPAEDMCGAGTGVDIAGQAHKAAVVRQGLALHREVIEAGDPLAVLACLGGFEIAAMAGCMLASASHRAPVILDGFISTVAALVGVTLSHELAPYLISGHVSTERAHATILDHLGLAPLLDLKMRLGEASGAAIAAYVVQCASRTLKETATFAEAHVSDRPL